MFVCAKVFTQAGLEEVFISFQTWLSSHSSVINLGHSGVVFFVIVYVGLIERAAVDWLFSRRSGYDTSAYEPLMLAASSSSVVGQSRHRTVDAVKQFQMYLVLK